VAGVVDTIEVERRTPFGENPVVGARGTKTQRRILLAALDVFAKHGYHDSRIEQITEAAGCSRPAFYQYFSSKEDVFRALASHVSRTVADMTERLGAITADREGRAALATWLREFADFFDLYAPVFSGFSAATRSNADLVDASAVVSKAFARRLRPHLRLDTDAVRRDVTASIVVTMVVRANLLRVAGGALADRARFVESLAGLIHRILVGPVPELDGGSQPAPPGPAVEPPTPVAQRDPGSDAAAGRTLSRQGQRMRARIIEAGTTVFPRLGFHETRVDDIVAAAGASHGSFYRYFDSKEDLFRVIATEAVDHLMSCIEAFPQAGDVAALRDWWVRWFRTYADHGGIIAVWREGPFADPMLAELTAHTVRQWLDRLAAVLDGRGVSDPRVDAMGFLGLIETIPHHVQALGYFDEEPAIDALVAICSRGFFGMATGVAS
jgi:AcrR family transcriptional regulator